MTVDPTNFIPRYLRTLEIASDNGEVVRNYAPYSKAWNTVRNLSSILFHFEPHLIGLFKEFCFLDCALFINATGN